MCRHFTSFSVLPLGKPQSQRPLNLKGLAVKLVLSCHTIAFETTLNLIRVTLLSKLLNLCLKMNISKIIVLLFVFFLQDTKCVYVLILTA